MNANEAEYRENMSVDPDKIIEFADFTLPDNATLEDLCVFMTSYNDEQVYKDKFGQILASM
jgi:hypothetical protein